MIVKGKHDTVLGKRTRLKTGKYKRKPHPLLVILCTFLTFVCVLYWFTALKQRGLAKTEEPTQKTIRNSKQ